MKIKIVSDGTAANTHVVNAETSQVIDNVIGITWSCNIDLPFANALIEFGNVPVEISGEIEGQEN